jgi:phosphoserine phosphatase RsbU/P
VLERAELLQEANANLRRLFEQAPGFVCFLRGPDHIFELANDAYYQLVGYRNIIGQPVRDALPEVIRQGFVEELDRVFATGRPVVGRGVKVAFERQPGDAPDELSLDFVYQPILDSRGKTLGIFVQGHDITALKRAEAALAHALEFEQHLIGIVSHDLRNPISAIAMATAVLQAQGTLSERQQHVVARLASSAERARRLLRDFLDLSQARSEGRIPIAPAPSNVREIIAGVLAELQITHPLRHASVEHDGDGTATWDGARIAQVVTNLLGNAFQHGSPTGVVQLSTRDEDDEVVITIHNDGPPIRPDDLPRVFEPFRRGAGSAATADRSVGLGLFISREIVQAHGGRIEVRSSAEDGTTFTVRLPRHAGGQPLT